MKKQVIKFYTLLISAILLFSSCQVIENEAGQKADIKFDLGTEVISIDDWSVNILSSDKSSLQPMCLAPPKPIEEIIANSYMIVKVKLDKLQKVETDYWCSLGDLYDYESTILKFYKGNTEDTQFNFKKYSITSFYHSGSGNISIFEEGKEYILFIRKDQSIYRGDSYEVDSLIFVMDDDKIVKQYQHGRLYQDNLFLTEDDFVGFLSQNIEDSAQNGKCFGCDFIESDDINDIVNFSEIIAKIVITRVTVLNHEIDWSNASVMCVEEYKGQMPKRISINLFNDDARIGEEAIILLTSEIYENGEGYNYAVSSRNSVIYEDDDRYERYITRIKLESLFENDCLLNLWNPIIELAKMNEIQDEISNLAPIRTTKSSQEYDEGIIPVGPYKAEEDYSEWTAEIPTYSEVEPEDIDN